MHSIYILINLHNGKAYIGQTSSTAEERFKSHVKHARKTPKSAISSAIALHGKRSFEIITLQLCTKEIANSAEQKWIEHYGTIVPNGYNLMTGGNAHNNKHSKESIEKMRINRRGTQLTEEHKAKLIAALRGHKQSLEHIEKRIAPLRGRKYPERVYHAPNKGKHHTTEAKAKISAAHKGKRHSPEFIERRIAPHRGMKRSAEARAKMSVAAKARQDRVRGSDGRFSSVVIREQLAQVPLLSSARSPLETTSKTIFLGAGDE